MLVYVDNPLSYVAVLAVILLFSKLLGLLFRKMRLPEVLGYIVAGLLLGPALFGDFLGFSLIGYESSVEAGDYVSLFAFEGSQGNNEVMQLFAKIGVLLLMFSAGLETDLGKIKSTGLPAFLMALFGVIVPMGLGILVSLPFGGIGLGTERIVRGVYVGTILTATSVAITVSVLKELGKLDGRIGTCIVSAAVIDDVIGILVLSLVTSLAGGGEGSSETPFEAFKSTPWGTIVMMLGFVAFALGVGYLLHLLFKHLEERHPNTHRLPVFGMVVCFLYAFLAETVFGVADITGAFLAGVVLSTVTRSRSYMDSRINVTIYAIFAPMFFANIGISSIVLSEVEPLLLLFCLLAVLVGMLGKFLACGAVARLSGFDIRDSLAGGIGMMPRGEVALIVTETVTDGGRLGENALPSSFSLMSVLLILVSSVLTPILLKLAFKGRGEGGEPPHGEGTGEATPGS